MVFLLLPDINCVAASFHLSRYVKHFIFALLLIVGWWGYLPLTHSALANLDSTKFWPSVLKADSIETNTPDLHFERLLRAIITCLVDQGVDTFWYTEVYSNWYLLLPSLLCCKLR